MIVQSTDSVKENKIKAVITGVSGVGKTSLLATLKTGGYKPLIISAEGGLLSIAGTGIDFIDITKDDEGKLIPKEKRVNKLMDVYNYVLTKEAMDKYDTICLDSLTELSQCLFDALRKEFPDRKENLVLYGELAGKTRDLIKAFRDIPHYNVVFTCLTKVEKDDNGRRFAGFDLIGSISDKLPQFFDAVLYLRANEKGERELICNSTDAIIAKDRSGKLDKSEPANLGSVFAKIQQQQEKTDEKVS